jgi:hypothetical protein
MLVGVTLTLVAATVPATALAGAARPGGRAGVQVVDLRVDGRHDEPLGLDNPHPLLSWRTVPTGASAGPACHRSSARAVCPADRQTAYQVQVADSERNLDRDRLTWDSGRVHSAVQSGVRYAGPALTSRERLVWRVRGELHIQPKVVGDLTFVRGSYETPQGTARSEWTREDGRLRLAVTVPPNTAADVWVPRLGGSVAGAPHRAQFLRIDGDYAVYGVMSGSYAFTTG